MKARTVPIVLLFVLSAVWSNDAIAADTSQVLVLEREILLDCVSGRSDRMAIDLERRHLAVAKLGNNTVDHLDLNNGRVMNRISGLDEPQGIAFVPSSDLFAVASGGDGSVKLFKGSPQDEPGGQCPPASNALWVDNSQPTLTIADHNMACRSVEPNIVRIIAQIDDAGRRRLIPPASKAWN
jgi:hypothetical protein